MREKVVGPSTFIHTNRIESQISFIVDRNRKAVGLLTERRDSPSGIVPDRLRRSRQHPLDRGSESSLPIKKRDNRLYRGAREFSASRE